MTSAPIRALSENNLACRGRPADRTATAPKAECEAPDLPDSMRSLLKGFIVSLANAGLITAADADALMRLLKLGDA